MDLNSDKSKTIFSSLLIIILITITIDLWQDFNTGSGFGHLLTEFLIAVVVGIGLFLLWSKNEDLKKEIQIKDLDLVKMKAVAEKWKSENAQLIQGLSSAIDKQLENWHLTPSEKDVALLLLKGLSLKEIADIRSVSERTVRQQSIGIYQKSHLAGRAELSAFFLEDLLK